MRRVNPHPLPDGSKAIIKLASPNERDLNCYMFGITRKMLEDNLDESTIVVLICTSGGKSSHAKKVFSIRAMNLYEKVSGLKPKKGVWDFIIYPDFEGDNDEVYFMKKDSKEKW